MQSNGIANDTLIRALLRQPTPHTPVWLMRQAGRYLPEYRATRARAGSFLQLAKSPALATEVTLQPLDRYDLDAAILFSDILTVPDAMGLGLQFVEGEGPRFERPVRDEADIAKLAVPSRDSLRYVYDAVGEIRRALVGSDGRQRVPLIGFSGSPWTLACYMIEGQSSRDFLVIKGMLYRRPDLLARLLDVVTDAVIDYLTAQIEAGAQTVMLFDTWGWRAVVRRLSALVAALHEAHPRRTAARARRRHDPDYPVHEGRWRVGVGDGGHRRRCDRPRLDREPRCGARDRRRALRLAGQSRPFGAARLGRCHPDGSHAHGEGVR